jgi:hypothetical protein
MCFLLITRSCQWIMTWWTDLTRHNNYIVSLCSICSCCIISNTLFPRPMRLCYSLVPEECFGLWGHQPSLCNWVIIKVSLRYLRKYLLGYMYYEGKLFLHVTDGYTPEPLCNAISYTPFKHVFNELNYNVIFDYYTSNLDLLGMILN